jgi:ADP-ribose pyrophosphatase YjhB (NUDIX family)
MQAHEYDLKKGIDFIGVTCMFFCHDGKGNILLQKRCQNCRDQQGRWYCGSGSMEFGESSFEDVIRREVAEEYGIDPLTVHFATATNVNREHNGRPTHWIALVHAVRVSREGVQIGEPEKIDEIGWFSIDALPDNVHSQLLRHLDLVKPFLDAER